MLVCDSCGHQNADDAGFCTNCGSYLEWTGRRQSAPQRSASSVRVTPTEVTVEPGKEAVCEVVMKNTGNVVDELVGKVVGDAAAWAVIEPQSVRLLPGQEEVARVFLRPPRSAMVRAGRTTFTLQVRSSVAGGEEMARHDCVVAVAPFAALQATIVPQTAEALESAEHNLMMRNEGNARADVQLRASDPDDRLVFEFEPQQHAIEPGSSAASRLRVSRRQGVSRPDQRFPFQVVVQPAGVAPVVLDGALVQQRPPAPPATSRRRMPWALPLGAALLLVAAGGVLVATHQAQPPLAKLPSRATVVTSTPSPGPTSTPTPPPTATPTTRPTSPPPPPGSTFEAEDLQLDSNVRGQVAPQLDCCGVTWSGHEQLFFRATGAGQYVTLHFNVAQAYRYLIQLRMTLAPDYGNCVIELDGQTLLPLFDGYNPTVATQSQTPGTRQLSAGQHLLTISVTGKVVQSSGFFAGIDYFTLTPQS